MATALNWPSTSTQTADSTAYYWQITNAAQHAKAAFDEVPKNPKTPPPPTIGDAPRLELMPARVATSTLEMRRRPRAEARPSRAIRERRRILTRC